MENLRKTKKMDTSYDLVGKKVIVPDKYDINKVCRIISCSLDHTIFYVKDFFGNKYEFGIEEIYIPDKMTEELVYPIIVKSIIRNGISIYVKKEEMPEFLDLLKIANFDITNIEFKNTYGGFLLNNGTVCQVMKADCQFYFETLKNRILSYGATRLDNYIILELQSKILEKNPYLRFTIHPFDKKDKYLEENDHLTNTKCYVFVSKIEFPKYIDIQKIEFDDDFKEDIEKYLATKGIFDISFGKDDKGFYFYSKNGFSQKDWFLDF